MKTKMLIISILVLGAFVTGLWGSNTVVARYKPNKNAKEIEKIEKLRTKRTNTKYAYRTLDSVTANQILLLPRQIKVAAD